MSEPIDGKIVAQVAKNVGFSGEELRIAVAIAKAESAWKADAYFPEADFFAARGYAHPSDTGQGSAGLWQTFEFEHPEFAGWNHFDPQVSACEMSMIWLRAGRSFNPWSTFRVQPPAYVNHLAEADAAIAALTLPSP